MPHLAFNYFHFVNRVWVSWGPQPRIGMIRFLMKSFHKFHVGQESDPKTCGRSNNCPRPTQHLTYRQSSEQAYATKHFFLLSLRSG